MSDSQIYSATYSSVPVFEFVTSEGPIMRRKLDSWINATHILKIARFPKAKRTRILEKDVQTGIHEKVQGGYGKYQGTYVPLDVGAQIARTFGVYEALQPIFEFVYIEGKSETPPPAPKHSHASASNVANRKLVSKDHKNNKVDRRTNINGKRESAGTGSTSGPTTTTTTNEHASKPNGGDEPPRKRGRPRKDTSKQSDAPSLENPPSLTHSDTIPIQQTNNKLPSISQYVTQTPTQQLFSGQQFYPPRIPNGAFLIPSYTQQYYQVSQPLGQRQSSITNTAVPLTRQNTVEDAPLVLQNNSMTLKHEDLESVESEDDQLGEEDENGAITFMNSKELFGTPRNSFERSIRFYNNPSDFSQNHSALQQFQQAASHQNSMLLPQASLQMLGSTKPVASDEYTEYYTFLLNYFLDDSKSRTNDIPQRILDPPLPLSKINILQTMDNDGNTIFHWACSMAIPQVISFLMDKFSIGSDIKNGYGETPLMFVVKFNNSFRVKNFPAILDYLFDSVFLMDDSGKTVLHHIAQIESKNKENFSKYYMECLLDRLFDVMDDDNVMERTQLISKFLNHQDANGNTAFHIVAFHMNKKCITILIKYHKYIDFSLKNLLNCTVEDYLLSHNYVLQLGKDNDDDEQIDEGVENPLPSKSEERYETTIETESAGSANIRKTVDSTNTITSSGENNGLHSSTEEFPLDSTKSFENQLHFSKIAMNLQNSTANIITEKLTELAYAVDKELAEKDEKLSNLFKIHKIFNHEKLISQREVLKIFKLDHLVNELEQEYATANPHDVVVDEHSDRLIQEEVYRLYNDLCFRFLQVLNDLEKKQNRLCTINEKAQQKKIQNAAEIRGQVLPIEVPQSTLNEDRILAAVKLTEAIIKRRGLVKQLYDKLLRAPVPQSGSETIDSTDCGENKENSAPPTSTNGVNSGSSIVDRFSPKDKLFKYCKLISLCCGMSVEEVEGSIDQIEQSLLKSR